MKESTPSTIINKDLTVKNELVVYKAIFGNYDLVSRAPVNKWNCDFICITDDLYFSAEGWIVIYVPSDGQSCATLNRQYKILAHRFFKKYRYSLYLDGNINLVGDPMPLISKYLLKNNIAIPSHPKRSCSYDEAAHNIKSGFGSEEIINRQMERYKSEGFPQEFGLTENGVLLRNHNDSEVIRLMELWWIEYCLGVKRDQMSLHYAAWKQGIHIAQIKEGPRVSNKYFHIGLHNSDNQTSWFSAIARYANGNQHRNWLYAMITQFVCLALYIRSYLKSLGRDIK